MLCVASLTHLCLRSCLLTDTGLRSLTLPARMSGAGLTSLHAVDLSGERAEQPVLGFRKVARFKHCST